jgi:hypothetical protein
MVPAARLPLPSTATTVGKVAMGEDAADQYDGFMEAEPNLFDSNATRYTRSFSMDIASLSPSRRPRHRWRHRSQMLSLRRRRSHSGQGPPRRGVVLSQSKLLYV